MLILIRLLALFLFATVSSISAQASAVRIDFAGQWYTQNDWISGPSAPTAVPVDFTASIVFDPATAWQAPGVFIPPPVNGYFRSYDVRFDTPSVTSSALNYQYPNPYAEYGVSAGSNVSMGRSDYPMYGVANDQSEQFRFSTNQSSLIQTTDALGTSSYFWGTGFSIYSPYWGIEKADLENIDQSFLLEPLYLAMAEGTIFSANYSSYTWVSAPTNYRNTGGFQEYGTATITGITELPEPATYGLFALGIALVCLIRKRVANKSR